jgi:hypothetical protein
MVLFPTNEQPHSAGIKVKKALDRRETPLCGGA